MRKVVCGDVNCIKQVTQQQDYSRVARSDQVCGKKALGSFRVFTKLSDPKLVHVLLTDFTLSFSNKLNTKNSSQFQ